MEGENYVFIIFFISFITVLAGVLFVRQPGANHAPRASVTQVNHSVHAPVSYTHLTLPTNREV